MKVFISWSGELSRAVAQLLREWLPDVLQGIEPWMSQEDIDKGKIWMADVQTALQSVSIGILCVTRANLNSPWLLFEAGALSNGLTSKRVCPLLIDVQQADVKDPLAQLNCTLATKEDMLRLLRSVNSSVERPLQSDQLERAFNRCWTEFETKFTAQRSAGLPEKVTHRKSDDILNDVLSTVRSIRSDLQQGPLTIEQKSLIRTVEITIENSIARAFSQTTNPLSHAALDSASVAGLYRPFENNNDVVHRIFAKKRTMQAKQNSAEKPKPQPGK